MRFPDWEKRLNDFCRQRMNQPDQTDFVADAVMAMTGMPDVSSDVLEMLPSVKLARRGDIVSMADNFGIVSLDGMRALFPDKDGLIRVAVLDCDSAWRVA